MAALTLKIHPTLLLMTLDRALDKPHPSHARFECPAASPAADSPSPASTPSAHRQTRDRAPRTPPDIPPDVRPECAPPPAHRCQDNPSTRDESPPAGRATSRSAGSDPAAATRAIPPRHRCAGAISFISPAATCEQASVPAAPLLIRTNALQSSSSLRPSTTVRSVALISVTPRPLTYSSR